MKTTTYLTVMLYGSWGRLLLSYPIIISNCNLLIRRLFVITR